MKTPIAVWKYCILYQQSAINIASPAFNISFFKGGKREAPHNVSCSDTLLDFFFFLFYQSLVNESKQTFILKCCFLMSFVCVRVNVSGGSTNVPIHFLWHCLETSDSPVSLNVYWHFSRARQKKKTPLKASCSSAASYLTLFGSIVFGSGWVRLCQTIYNTILSLCLGLESLPNLPHTESDIWATYRHRNTVRWIMHKKSSPKRQQRPTYLNLPISCSFVWKMLVQGPMRNLHPRATSH